jgi:CheY-like chemotaxis protein
MDQKELDFYYNEFKFGEDVFHNLMKNKVNEILLVSTFYDAFIFEQDGRLSEQIHGEYRQLNLSTAPRILSVPTGIQALEILKERKFDLIITMMRIGELTPFELGKKVKELYPDLPVLLLLNVSNDIGLIDKESSEMQNIDNVFNWNGDSKIFLAMIKYIEDIWNVENDTEQGSVRVILLVEDSIHYYSIYHPLLYEEILKQTQKLINEELDDISKRRRMRGRPKVLLCHSYEQAVETYEKYREFIIAVISDIRYKKAGVEDPVAGLKLIEFLREKDADCPILLQSSEMKNKSRADELQVHFLHKTSKRLLHDLREFILKNLGFGAFVFRYEDGSEINRVNTVEEFEKILAEIPDESLLYHSRQNNFSAWLTAHGEFLFAKKIRGLKITDFEATSQIREHLISVFKEVHYTRNRGKIIQFDPGFLDVKDGIIRLAEGSLGGKGRGLAFLNSLFVTMDFESLYENVNIKIPRTFIIGTSEYDLFIELNKIDSNLLDRTDEKINKRFLAGSLSTELQNVLKIFINKVSFPLVVRSSGLLEDSQSQPFAGIYKTIMLPNNNPDEDIRLQNLMDSIKMVFSSVYLQSARNYIESINYKLEEEKMAVIIQEIVGEEYGGYYYPHISGVGQSFNFYPTADLHNSDGIASIAYGLGKTVVEGGGHFHFSPRYPQKQLIPSQKKLGNTQKELYVLDLQDKNFRFIEKHEGNLKKIEVKEMLEHDSFKHFASIMDNKNNILNEGLSTRGSEIISFTDILKNELFPLASILENSLEIGEKAMGVPVEIEFAVNFSCNKLENKLPTFYLLQIRPLNIYQEEINIETRDINKEELFLFTTNGMGNGIINNIIDIIFVDPERFSKKHTIEMKKEIAYLNKKLQEKEREFILIGPGRWGSRNRFLGIPVDWHEINNAKIIVESGLENFEVEPSQGTHFFRNLVSMNVGYFNVPASSKKDFINWDWLKSQSVKEKTEHFVHLEMDHPIIIKMNGKKGISCIFK